MESDVIDNQPIMMKCAIVGAEGFCKSEEPAEEQSAW